MTARTDRRIALLAGGALAALCILGAAVQIAFWSIGSAHRDLDRTIPGPVHTLSIDARGADITIEPGGTGVELHAHGSGALHVPRVTATVDGAHVTVRGGCPDISFGHCSAMMTVRVPATTRLELRSGTGHVQVSGISGGADIRTASGDIVASDLGGSVALQSASGDVHATGLSADSVRARTASGEVDLAFVGPPRFADAETASGDARILVPPGGEGYRVDAETHSGDRTVGVRVDDASGRRLRAHTTSGDAIVDYAG